MKAAPLKTTNYTTVGSNTNTLMAITFGGKLDVDYVLNLCYNLIFES